VGEHIKIATEIGQVDGVAQAGSAPAGMALDTPVMLLLRPENVHMSMPGERAEGAPGVVAGTIEDSIIMGGLVRHHVRVAPNLQMIVQKQNHRACSALARGAQVHLHWAREDCQVLATN